MDILLNSKTIFFAHFFKSDLSWIFFKTNISKKIDFESQSFNTVYAVWENWWPGNYFFWYFGENKNTISVKLATLGHILKQQAFRRQVNFTSKFVLWGTHQFELFCSSTIFIFSTFFVLLPTNFTTTKTVLQPVLLDQ